MKVDLSFLIEAETVIHEFGDAGIHDAVVDVVPVAAGIEDPDVYKPPELVRNRLRFHAHRIGQIGHTGIVLQDQSVQQAEARFRGENFKNPSKFSSRFYA